MSTDKRVVASFDIGGTNLRAAVVVVDGDGARLLDQSRRATPSHLLLPDIPAAARLADVLDFITGYAREAQARFGADAVAAAFPGPIDEHGRVVALPTLWGIGGQSLCPIDLVADIGSRVPGMQVRVYNDVSAAGFRFAAQHADFALFTLGSGVGLKVFVGGRPQVGPHGQGGELTHMVFDTAVDAPICDCGGRGHLGALASGRAWQRLNRDGSAKLRDFAEPLARAVAMLHFALGLERFIFAGGLTEALGEPLRLAIVERLPEQGWQIGQDWNAMVSLAPADDAHALLGGAMSFAQTANP
jgi:glucokinase